MNVGLTGSRLFGDNIDWLRAIGPYNGLLASDRPGKTFADDHALRAAKNSFPFTAPIPQVVVNANSKPEERVASKFGINSYGWANQDSSEDYAQRFVDGLLGAVKAVTVEPLLQVHGLGLAAWSARSQRLWNV
jgi:hypothetical protein